MKMNMISKIRSYFRFYSTIINATESSVKISTERLYSKLVMRDLYYKSINETRKGVSEQTVSDAPVVVSLTTYGKRLLSVHLTIESIMQGSVLPNRLILWLAEEERERTLPIALQRQVDRGLEIKYCRDIKSYKKLVPTLNIASSSIVVTIDDDMFYQPDMLEGLLVNHKKYPKDIIAYRVDEMTMDHNDRPCSCLSWKSFSSSEVPLPTLVAIGAEGILYPPESLAKEVVDENVFMSLCPTADDLWFKAMALKRGTLVRHAETSYERGGGAIPNWEVQNYSLQQINEDINDCKNDIQLDSVFSYFELFNKLKS